MTTRLQQDGLAAFLDVVQVDLALLEREEELLECLAWVDEHWVLAVPVAVPAPAAGEPVERARSRLRAVEGFFVSVGVVGREEVGRPGRLVAELSLRRVRLRADAGREGQVRVRLVAPIIPVAARLQVLGSRAYLVKRIVYVLDLG